jgi:hypothetical protein
MANVGSRRKSAQNHAVRIMQFGGCEMIAIVFLLGALAPMPALAIGPEIPKWNPTRSCRAVVNTLQGHQHFKRCVESERESLVDLQHKWKSYSDTVRLQCISTNEFKAYVELGTCLDFPDLFSKVN